MDQTLTPNLVRIPPAGLPTIRLAGRYPLDDQGFAAQYRGPFVSLHLYSYSATIRIGGRSFSIKPGDVTLTPANVPAAYDLPHPGYHLCVHFTPPRLRGPAADVPLHQTLGIRRDLATQRLLQIIEHHSRAARDATARAAASAGLLELLLWLSMSHAIGRGRDKPRRARRIDAALDRAATLLEQSLDQPMHVPTLADAVELSQNYLARHFRARFGVTLQHYLLVRRVELAEHLLGTTNLPIARIGERVGLPDPQHFNKQFRRLVGLSPSRVREAAGKSQRRWPAQWRKIRQALEERERGDG